VLPPLPPKSQYDLARELGRRREWPDDPLYEYEIAPVDIRPDPVWMAMRGGFEMIRSFMTRIGSGHRGLRSAPVRTASPDGVVATTSSHGPLGCDGC
jgi:hypothetical protein